MSPSGRSLCRAVARRVDPAIPGPIIELGPGTGPVTEALIKRGIAPERLILVEFEPTFCTLLRRRFPRCRIVQGDAYALRHTLGSLLTVPAAAVVSSLPLLNRPDAQRLTLLDEAFSLMRPGAPFVQFTYGLISPIPRRRGRVLPPTFHAEASGPVWLNLPPARVWTYRATLDRAMRQSPDLIDRLRLGGEKLGDEWRELRAEWAARGRKVRIGIAKHRKRLKAARDAHASHHPDTLLH